MFSHLLELLEVMAKGSTDVDQKDGIGRILHTLNQPLFN